MQPRAGHDQPEMQQANSWTSIDNRRRLGRYDTPRPLSQAVADWAIRLPADEVLEPSSGSGVFVSSAIHRLKSLRSANPLEQVWACDIDAVAVEETIKETGLGREHVWHQDFLSVAGVNGVRGRKFNCVIGNPPYISLHRMEPRQREEACAAADRLGVPIDRKASLWAYFLVGAVHAVREAGRIAMVLPESIFHADYARPLIGEVAKRFEELLLLSIRERCFVSEGAAERIVLMLGRGFRPPSEAAQILLHESADVLGAVRFLADEQLSARRVLPKLNGHAVPHLLRARHAPSVDLSSITCSHALGDFAEIRIGVVTGANDFFVITEEQRKAHHLPVSAVVPVLPRFRFCRGLVFKTSDWNELRKQGAKCWLLFPAKNERRHNLLRYLAHYPPGKRRRNITFGKRTPWFRSELGLRPDAFLQYMGATAPRLALSACQATCTNTVHRVYFRKRVRALSRKAIALSLLSSFSRLSAEIEGRTYGSGVLKLEPSEGRRIRLLLPRSLSANPLDCYLKRVESHLASGDVESATSVADEWLYRSVAGLARTLPLATLRACLHAAVRRRLSD